MRASSFSEIVVRSAFCMSVMITRSRSGNRVQCVPDSRSLRRDSSCTVTPMYTWEISSVTSSSISSSPSVRCVCSLSLRGCAPQILFGFSLPPLVPVSPLGCPADDARRISLVATLQMTLAGSLSLVVADILRTTKSTVKGQRVSRMSYI